MGKIIDGLFGKKCSSCGGRTKNESQICQKCQKRQEIMAEAPNIKCPIDGEEMAKHFLSDISLVYYYCPACNRTLIDDHALTYLMGVFGRQQNI